MKKNFETLQSDFYNEVKTYLPNLFNKVNTLQLLKSDEMYQAAISFTDVTGRNRDEWFVIDTINDTSSSDAKYLADMFRSRLIEQYPGFVEFESVEEAVRAAIDNGDPAMVYRYEDVEISYYVGHFGEEGIVWSQGEVVDHIPFTDEELTADDYDEHCVQRISDHIRLNAFNDDSVL